MTATESAKESARRTYLERKAHGLCTRCASPFPDITLYRTLCDTCRGKNTAVTKERRHRHPEQFREKDRRYRKRVRSEAFQAYGTTCACCGDSRWYVLQLDHINGGGRKHIEESGTYYRMLARLRADGWPPIMQVLCANCHLAKTTLGACPKEHRADDLV